MLVFLLNYIYVNLTVFHISFIYTKLCIQQVPRSKTGCKLCVVVADGDGGAGGGTVHCEAGEGSKGKQP